MDDLLLIVKPIEMDRQMRLEGYEIESLFPFRVERAGTFGRNAQSESLALIRFCSQIIRHAGMFASPHRNTSHLSEDRT